MKNEKAYITSLSYVIGFTTAFIAFGIPLIQMNNYQSLDVTAPTNFSYSDQSAVQSANAISAYITDEGLFASVDGKERIISAHDPVLAETEEGFHYAVPLATVSPDEKFIHFCEQSLEIPTECLNYVFDFANDVVWRVKHDDVQLVSQIETVHSSWLDDGRLSFDGLTSVDGETPWVMQ